GRVEIATKSRLIAKQQVEARRQEPQLEIFTQEILLLWREQRRFRAVQIFDPHQLPYILPDLPQKTAPRRFVLCLYGRRRRGEALLECQRQRIHRRDGLVQSQRHPGNVDEGHCLKTIHVTGQCAPQRQELRPVQTLELGIGELQRRERRRNVP